MLIITCRQNGFRRCGIAHLATPTEYPDDRFTEEELAILEQEPMLVITRVADPAAEKSKGKESKVSTTGEGAA